MRLKKIARLALETIRVIPRTQFKTTFVTDNPALDTLPAQQIIIVGSPHFQKWVYMKCPCGCGDPIMLSLSSKRRPTWTAKIDWLDRATLAPSIRQTSGCYSHFWLRQGRVHWCADTGQLTPAADNNENRAHRRSALEYLAERDQEFGLR